MYQIGHLKWTHPKMDKKKKVSWFNTFAKTLLNMNASQQGKTFAVLANMIDRKKVIPLKIVSLGL